MLIEFDVKTKGFCYIKIIAEMFGEYQVSHILHG